jgi:hypothetical protein
MLGGEIEAGAVDVRAESSGTKLDKTELQISNIDIFKAFRFSIGCLIPRIQ